MSLGYQKATVGANFPILVLTGQQQKKWHLQASIPNSFEK